MKQKMCQRKNIMNEKVKLCQDFLKVKMHTMCLTSMRPKYSTNAHIARFVFKP